MICSQIMLGISGKHNASLMQINNDSLTMALEKGSAIKLLLQKTGPVQQ